MPVELSSFWMCDFSLVREPPRGAGQTMGGLQLVKPTSLVGERAALAERRGQWWQEREWVPWEGWMWSVERRECVGWQGGSVGKQSMWRGCIMAVDHGWVVSQWFYGAMCAWCTCEHNERQWDGGGSSGGIERVVVAGWRGWQWQEGEGSSSRKERAAVAGRQGQQRQEGEGSDGGTEMGLTHSRSRNSINHASRHTTTPLFKRSQEPGHIPDHSAWYVTHGDHYQLGHAIVCHAACAAHLG